MTRVSLVICEAVVDSEKEEDNEVHEGTISSIFVVTFDNWDFEVASSFDDDNKFDEALLIVSDSRKM